MIRTRDDVVESEGMTEASAKKKMLEIQHLRDVVFSPHNLVMKGKKHVGEPSSSKRAFMTSFSLFN